MSKNTNERKPGAPPTFSASLTQTPTMQELAAVRRFLAGLCYGSNDDSCPSSLLVRDWIQARTALEPMLESVVSARGKVHSGHEDVEFATFEWVHWYNTQRLFRRSQCLDGSPSLPVPPTLRKVSISSHRKGFLRMCAAKSSTVFRRGSAMRAESRP